MKLEYERGTLRIENAAGLRWQLTNAEKPPFTFDYDALSVTEERAVLRLGASLQPLALDQIRQVKLYIERLRPPEWATVRNQLVADLRAMARGLIASLVTQLGYDSVLDVVVAGREGSTDLQAEQARRFLAYVDSVWNAYHGLAAQIEQAAEADLKPLRDYAAMMPLPPPLHHFSGGILQELLSGSRGDM